MRIVIIGGGIAGLTTAVALQRRGLDAHVYESAAELDPVGKGIWVPTNAMLVLDRLALGDAVAARGVALGHAELRAKDDGVLQAIDLADIRQRFGRTTISILRAELQAVLAGALGTDTLHLGKRCVAITERTEREGGVVAAFEDGTTAVGDVLIGADGIRSITRRAVSDHVSLRYAGQTCYLGVSAFQLPADLASTSWEVWGGAHRFGFSPVAADQVYWFAPVTAPEASPASTDDMTIPLHAEYIDFPDPIPQIIHHTPLAEIIRVDLYDIPPLKDWYRGRVVLVGDAAHAMTPNLGQGGAQAIEDAYVLAAALAREETTAAALQVYTQLRQPKARRLVRLSWWFGQLAHLEAPWARGLRNSVLRALPARISRRQMDALYELKY